MAHLDAYLEKCPGFGSGSTPTFSTTVVLLRNKHKRKNAEWSQPEWRFVIVFNNNMPEAYQQVLDMLLVCRGRLHSFRARNWQFYKAENWKFATGDGVTDEFQLGRLVEIGGESFLQEIHALSLDDDAPTPVVTANGAPVAGVFDDRTGRFLADNPPANGAVLRFSAWFDFWVEFETDDMPATIDNKSQGEFVTNYQVNLVESDPPDESFSS